MGKKCIIFDFDCTITEKHFYYLMEDKITFIGMYDNKYGIKTKNDVLFGLILYIESLRHYNNDMSINEFITTNIIKDDKKVNDLIEIIFGSRERLEMLRKFFDKCQKEGIDLCISSRGIFSDIIIALKLTNLLPYFKIVHSVGDYIIYYSETNSCEKKYAHGKEDLIIEMTDRYTTVIYIDDDHSVHNKLLNSAVNVYEKNDNYEWCKFIKNTDKNYFFVNTLEKNIGGGIKDGEIKIMNEIIKRN